MMQQLELTQEQRLELSDLKPVFITKGTTLAHAEAFSIKLVEIEINNPDNLTLHVKKENKEGKSITRQIKFKDYHDRFEHRNNKHILVTDKIKEFHFNTATSSLKEVKVTSEKFKSFRIALQYSTPSGS